MMSSSAPAPASGGPSCAACTLSQTSSSADADGICHFPSTTRCSRRRTCWPLRARGRASDAAARRQSRSFFMVSTVMAPLTSLPPSSCMNVLAAGWPQNKSTRTWPACLLPTFRQTIGQRSFLSRTLTACPSGTLPTKPIDDFVLRCRPAWTLARASCGQACHWCVLGRHPRRSSEGASILPQLARDLAAKSLHKFSAPSVDVRGLIRQCEDGWRPKT